VKITAVRASWLCAVIPAERAHVSDFGRNDSFNTCLVEIDTDTGQTGLGEAKIGAGNLGNYAATVETIRAELAPILLGRDPPTSPRCGRRCTTARARTTPSAKGARSRSSAAAA
jgi:L-alanine-DL-glutamate epimerase-like enolase superfamily enzyme